MFLLFGKAQYELVRGYKLLIILVHEVSQLPSAPHAPDFGEFGRRSVIILQVSYIARRLRIIRKNLGGRRLGTES